MFQAGCCLFFIIFLISKQYQSFKGCCVHGRTVEGPYTKKECHTNYQKFRNLLSTLMKKNKQAYYDKYFERNWNNVKNTWKEIKSLISLKNCSIPCIIVHPLIMVIL